MRTFSLAPLFILGLIASGVFSSCSPPPIRTAGGNDIVVLEFEQIDLEPGAQMVVRLKQGRATKAEAPKGSGLTARLPTVPTASEITITAAPDAKEGSSDVTVSSLSDMTITLKVNVKKKTAVPEHKEGKKK